ncbi:hypothetical protein [Amycolatopsis samaneae]|uniref:Uncharacterized protein n=1 Tax=Amycolatopsis samaneae TaxID=664691 RepID=A0ABW5GI70_9PSEU
MRADDQARVQDTWYVPLFYCVLAAAQAVNSPSDLASVPLRLGENIYALAAWIDKTLDEYSDIEASTRLMRRLTMKFKEGTPIPDSFYPPHAAPPELRDALNLITQDPHGRPLRGKMAQIIEEIVAIASQKRTAAEVVEYADILQREAVAAADWFSLPFAFRTQSLQVKFSRFATTLFTAGLYYDAAIDMEDDFRAGLLTLVPTRRAKVTLLYLALKNLVASTLRYPRPTIKYYQALKAL